MKVVERVKCGERGDGSLVRYEGVATWFSVYCQKGKERVWVFVNGRRWLGNPRTISLQPHQEIVVAYGTFRSIPKPIPKAYAFPPGY